MVDRDPELSGGCLCQTSAGVRLGLGGKLNLLLAGSTHPSGEPLSRQFGLRRAQAPRTGWTCTSAPNRAELLDGDRHRVRAEQAPSLGDAPLVGVKRNGDATIQGLRRRQLDPAHDRQGQQDEATAPRRSR